MQLGMRNAGANDRISFDAMRRRREECSMRQLMLIAEGRVTYAATPDYLEA